MHGCLRWIERCWVLRRHTRLITSGEALIINKHDPMWPTEDTATFYIGVITRVSESAVLTRRRFMVSRLLTTRSWPRRTVRTSSCATAVLWYVVCDRLSSV